MSLLLVVTEHLFTQGILGMSFEV